MMKLKKIMRLVKKIAQEVDNFSNYSEKRYKKICHEYSNAIVHAFQKFKAPFSGKIVHIFPEQSAVI